MKKKKNNRKLFNKKSSVNWLVKECKPRPILSSPTQLCNEFVSKKKEEKEKIIDKKAHMQISLWTKENGLFKEDEKKALENAWKKELNKKDKLRWRKNPLLKKTKKPLESKQGKGKGSEDKLVMPLKAGDYLVDVITNEKISLKKLSKLRKLATSLLSVGVNIKRL